MESCPIIHLCVWLLLSIKSRTSSMLLSVIYLSLLYGILLREYIIDFVSALMDIRVVFSLGQLKSALLWTFIVFLLVDIKIDLCIEIYSGLEMLGYMICICSVLVETIKQFPKTFVQIYIPLNSAWEYRCAPYPHWHLVQE